MSFSGSSSMSAQELLNALIELRRLGKADAFHDSKRFRSYMLDLHPELKREVRVLYGLIEAGLWQCLQEADDSGRAIIVGQIKLWLDEELMLKAETAQSFCDVLLAFCNGESKVQAAQPLSGAGEASGQALPLAEWCDKGVSFYKKGQYGEAAYWFRKTAEQGYAKGQNCLGVMYVNGRGVERDYVQAVSWYRKSAEQGYASSQYNLGVMYENGRGVEKDCVQAVFWFRKAAGQGHVRAKEILSGFKR